MSLTQNAETLERLDQLLSVIDRCTPRDEAELAHEHIQEARTYLLGAMPIEYQLNLGLTRDSLARMSETDARRSAETLLKNLIHMRIE